MTVVVVSRERVDLLAACLDDLGRQAGCVVDAVVVDDRGDAPDRLDEICDARAVPHVRVADAAADGWLPWNAALRAGLSLTAGTVDWVLLFDHPLRLLRDDAVARVLAGAYRDRATALWLIPRMRGGLLAPSLLTAIADALPAMAAINLDRESVPWPGAACLIRRDLVQRTLEDPRAAMAPMLEAVVLESAQDRDRLARYAFATDELDAPRPSWPTALESVERLLAMLGFRAGLVVIGLAIYGALWGLAVRGVTTGEPWGLWAFGGLASLAVPCVMIARTIGTNVAAGVLAPFVFPIEAAATLFAIGRARTRGGVAWRGRFFTLDELRAGAQRD